MEKKELLEMLHGAFRESRQLSQEESKSAFEYFKKTNDLDVLVEMIAVNKNYFNAAFKPLALVGNKDFIARAYFANMEIADFLSKTELQDLKQNFDEYSNRKEIADFFSAHYEDYAKDIFKDYLDETISLKEMKEEKEKYSAKVETGYFGDKYVHEYKKDK